MTRAKDRNEALKRSSRFHLARPYPRHWYLSLELCITSRFAFEDNSLTRNGVTDDSNAGLFPEHLENNFRDKARGE